MTVVAVAGRRRRMCVKCGWKGSVAPRQKHCYQRRFGKGSYACWGTLVDLPRKQRNPVAVPTPEGLGVGWQLGEEAEAQRMEQFREQARKELARARKHLDAAIEDVTRATRRLELWRSKIVRLERKTQMTDAEIAALRAKRSAAVAKGRQRRHRRAMAI
jgi:hypothetical protein